MSEPAAAAPSAPAETSTSAQSPAPAAPATPSQPAQEQDPNWLPSRLERERKSIAKKLGVESIDELEAFVKEARELKQSQMSEAEKLRLRVAELEAKAKDRDEIATSLATYANSQLAALTNEQRAAVQAIAGDNPSAIVRAIDSLRPTWAVVAAAAPAAPLPAPATTAPPANAPAPSSAAGTNHLAVWQQLKASNNPLRAAEYLLQHEAEIVKARQA